MSTGPNSRQPGLVVAAHGRRGHIETSHGKRLPFLAKGRNLKIVCGDRVYWQNSDDNSVAVISEILPRNNALARLAQASSKTEILAANLSTLVVVCAPQPEPDWFLIDRYLCTGRLIECRVILAVNKVDIVDSLSSYESILKDYERIGYQVNRVSAKKNLGLEQLKSSLCNETAILVGQSGVGKSSLINRIVPDAGILTGRISTSTLEGKHTTTASEMHDLEDGGRLIDTPGVRDFIPAIPETASIQYGFPEFQKASEDCRFSNCLHLREPECGIKTAVEAGAIHKRRYESYKRLINSVKNQKTF